jgi:hypothetical protein
VVNVALCYDAGMRPKTIPELSPAEVQRFWSHVERSSGCWTWSGASTVADGFRYGVWKHRGRLLRVHRVAYQIAGGILDLDCTVDHTCENKLCCNPEHLEQVTPSENTSRAYARHPERLSRLTDEQKRERNRAAQQQWRDRQKTG